jgi:hypothetical protein
MALHAAWIPLHQLRQPQSDTDKFATSKTDHQTTAGRKTGAISLPLSMIAGSMKLALLLLAATATFAISLPADARSYAAKVEFKRLNPCPSTGKHKGPCPGYIIDHIKPLACNGDDAPHNMQWQTTEEAKAKDKWERKGCH